MPFDTLRIAWFESLEEGYLLALAGDSEATRAAVRVILALDPWQRVWLPEEGAWWISDDAISLVARRVPVVEEAFARWHAAPPPPPGQETRSRRTFGARPGIALVPPPVAAAYAALGLAPGADSQAVKMARRRLAQRCHPDAGGTNAAMATVNAAADTIMRWLVAQQRATV